MQPLLEQILTKLESDDPASVQKLRQRLDQLGEEYQHDAADFFARYDQALRLDGKTIDYAIDCYRHLTADMQTERLEFLRTGKYANSSYKEVEQKIYGNPAIMDYHMHGLALAQYLWPDQFERLDFFRTHLSEYTADCAAYLEVGGGHGLYMWTALKQLPASTRLDLLDISASSIKLAQQIIGPSRVNYILRDIFEFDADGAYDFITAGEIIEHLEDPLAFLKKIASLLSPRGTLYLTTPVNAPMIDHIYLFNHVDEIRSLMAEAGFAVAAERIAPSRELPERLIVKQKVPVMYAGFFQRAS